MGIGSALATVGGKIALGWKAHGATITFVAGAAGAIGAGILAAKGWVECKRIIDHKAEEIDKIEENVGKTLAMDDGTERLYTEEDAKHDIAATKRATFFGCAKALAPAVAVGAGSLAALGYSHMNLKGQLASTMAYAGAIESQLSNYRIRVQDTIGVDQEQRVWDGVKATTEITDVVNPETGEVTTVVEDKEVRSAGIEVPSNGVIRFIFGHECSGWNPGQRELNLTQAEFFFSSLNDMLQTRQFVDMRDVYDAFAVPPKDRTAGETVIGWVRVDKNSHIEYRVLNPIGQEDPAELIIEVTTDGLILNKLAEIRKKTKKGA